MGIALVRDEAHTAPTLCGRLPASGAGRGLLVLNDITKALVERLRCEPDIEGLSYDTPIHIG